MKKSHLNSNKEVLQSKKTALHDFENTFQFKDNRPEKAAQLKMQEVANESVNIIQPKANNTGLPNQLKSGIENLSGFSMDDVKVHYNSPKPAQLQAHAYAQGTDIHIASGQEKHLPHEAWHVVQQKQGRVKPTMQLKGTVNINDDAGLEKEADVMGGKALGVQFKKNSDGNNIILNNRYFPIQRILAKKGKIWSSFLTTTWIDENQAVITAGSNDSLTGGHSYIILEYQAGDGLVHAKRIDLFVDPEGNMPIVIKDRQVEVKPWVGILGASLSLIGNNELSVEGTLENPGKASSHIIKGANAAGVIAMAERFVGTINHNYYYATAGYGVPTKLADIGKSAINCAWFASMLLEAGGVKGKSSVIPSSLSANKSSKEENDERFKI